MDSPAYWTDPNHLIYAWVGGLFYKAMLYVDPAARAVAAFQVMDIVFGIFGVYLFYEFLKCFFIEKQVRLLGMLLFGLCAAWWNYSTDISSYVVAVDCLILTSLFVLKRPLYWWPAALLSFVLSLLFHQMSVIYVFPIIVLALAQNRLRKSLVALICASGCISLGVEYLAYAVNPIYREAVPAGVATGDGGGIRVGYSFSDWLFTHSADSSFSFSPIVSIQGAISGIIKLFLGGKIGDIVYVTMYEWGIVLVAALVFFFLLRKYQAVFVSHGSCEGASILPPDLLKTAILLSLSWFFSYMVFLFIWMPNNSFYRLFAFPPMLALCVWKLRPYFKGGSVWVAVTITVLMVWNLCFYIIPRSHASRNIPLVMANVLSSKLEESQEIIYRDFHTDNWTIRYFTMDAQWYAMRDRSPLESEVPVWVDGTAWNWMSQNKVAAECLSVVDTAEVKSRDMTIVFRLVLPRGDCGRGLAVGD